MSALRNADAADVETIEKCMHLMRYIRDDLKGVGAKKAARAVARALKSVEGAARHADRCWWHYHRNDE